MAALYSLSSISAEKAIQNKPLTYSNHSKQKRPELSEVHIK